MLEQHPKAVTKILQQSGHASWPRESAKKGLDGFMTRALSGGSSVTQRDHWIRARGAQSGDIARQQSNQG
jgi:hypothetical protein